MRLQLACAAAGMAAALVLAAPAGAADWTAGAPTANDPFFGDVGMGNGGYDVQHYSLDLAYDPATQILDGKAKIRLIPTQDLDQFNLDLRTKQEGDTEGLTVSRVAIGNQKPAWFTPAEFAASIPPGPLGESVGEFTATYNALRFGGHAATASRLSLLLDRMERG